MPKIINERYNQFLKEGIITTIDKGDLTNYLNKIKTKHVLEARSMIIMMYYTGARPAEVLNMVAKDIKQEGQSYIVITTKALKNGLPRQIRLRLRAT